MRKIHADVGRGYIGRRVICEVLGRTGVRVSELCDLKIGQVRLHDPEGARFRIPDSKTETGIREVHMTPDLIEPVIEHLDRLRRIGAPTGPEDYLIPNTRGGRIDRQRVGKIVGEAAARSLSSASSAATGRASTDWFAPPASNRLGTDWGLTPKSTLSTSPRAFPTRLRIPLWKAPAAKWREADSNRRHHDFQKAAEGPDEGPDTQEEGGEPGEC
jgi:Phage integrase family